MAYLWGFYWILIFWSILISIISIKNKNIKLGINNLLLGILVPIWSIVFSLHRNYTGGEVNEFKYFFDKIMQGDIQAILIVLGYIFLAFLTIINARKKQ